MQQLLWPTLYLLKMSLNWHLYCEWPLLLTFFLDSMLKGFRVLRSGNSVRLRQFRLRVIERYIWIIISHAVDVTFTYGNQIKARNIFAWYSTKILTICKMRQQLHMAWFIFYIMKKYFQVYFFKNHNIYFLDAYFSFLRSFF